MSTNDMVIANQGTAAFRVDLNSALQALASNSLSSSQPSTTYAGQFWFDSTNNILKIKDKDGSAFVNVAYIHPTDDTFQILDNTLVVDTSGTQTGLLGDQASSAWTTGTGTTESLVSPAKVKAAIDQFAPDSVGVSQTWQDMSSSRTAGTAYQNTSGKAIHVAVQLGTGTTYLQVSSDGSTYLSIANGNASTTAPASAIIPNNHYYKVVGSYTRWHELR